MEDGTRMYRLERLTSQDLNVSSDCVAVLPIGAIEPHGPHLPLSTDNYLSMHLADALAEAVGGLVMPAVPYGVHTDTWRLGGTFPGAIGVGGEAFMSIVRDLLVSAERTGFRGVAIVNSAIDNQSFVVEAARSADVSLDFGVTLLQWWDFVDTELRSEVAELAGVDTCDDHHAGTSETSLLYAVAPDRALPSRLVAPIDHPARRVRHFVRPFPPEATTRTGIVYDARGASPEIGDLILAAVVPEMVLTCRKDLRLG
jgi:creatinine amidohydrolase